MTDNIGNAPAASSQRLEYIDVAKGIGIFLVVLGHSVEGDNLLHNFIYSFHVPLFFFLSGLCFNDAKHTEFVPFLTRRARTLILPMLYFTVLFLLISFVTPIRFYTIESVVEGSWPAVYWYIYILFLSELLYWLINHTIRSISFKVVVLVVCLCIGIALNRMGILLPFNHCSVFGATFFYGVGHLCRGGMSMKLANAPLIGGVLVIPLLSAHYIGGTLNMCINWIRSPEVISYFVALMGIAGTLVLSSALCHTNEKIKNFIIYMGANTYVIVLVHFPIRNQIRHFIEPFVASDTAEAVCEQIFMWPLLLVCIYIINAYLPWLVGKEKRNKQVP